MRLSAAALFVLLVAGVSAVADSRVIVEVAVPVTTSSVPDDIESVEGQHRIQTSRAGAMEATGTIQVVRCEHFRNSDVRLDRFQGNSTHAVLVFEADYRLAAPEWFSVPAMQCTANHVCESLPDAQIQFDPKASRDWMRRWRLGGGYRITSADGTKEEGKFRLRSLKRDPSVICM